MQDRIVMPSDAWYCLSMLDNMNNMAAQFAKGVWRWS
jgi:hypothetical protein